MTMCGLNSHSGMTRTPRPPGADDARMTVPTGTPRRVTRGTRPGWRPVAAGGGGPAGPLPARPTRTGAQRGRPHAGRGSSVAFAMPTAPRRASPAGTASGGHGSSAGGDARCRGSDTVTARFQLAYGGEPTGGGRAPTAGPARWPRRARRRSWASDQARRARGGRGAAGQPTRRRRRPSGHTMAAATAARRAMAATAARPRHAADDAGRVAVALPVAARPVASARGSDISAAPRMSAAGEGRGSRPGRAARAGELPAVPDTTGQRGRGTEVDDLRVTGLGEQRGHDLRGAGGRLGGQLDLDRPRLPGVAAGRLGGRPDDLGVRDVPACPTWGAEGGRGCPRSHRHQARPLCRRARIRSQMRAARTARTWARRDSGGGAASHVWPAWLMPAGVSQHQAGPGPSTPVTAHPAARHRDRDRPHPGRAGALSAAASRS